MKIALAFLTMFVFSPALLSSQNSTPPPISHKPLTTDQIEVYRAFLNGYLKGFNGQINVANITGALQPDSDDFAGCMKEFPKDSHALEIHRFTNEFQGDGRIRLVDPEKYKTSDVGDLTQSGENLDRAVTSAINAGLLSLSEVIIDHKHHLAALNYGFRCGRLCGNGGTVIFELHNGRWSRSKRSCGYWQS